jgi:ATP-binding cassette subfamily F protein 3
MSGGEKARLVLCMIVWQRPNLLLLDEPTNHLDLATREALAMALNEFEGTVMLVSHDRALLRSVCDEFWMVSRGGVEPFDGDLDDYQKYLLDEAKRQRELAKEEAKAGVPAVSVTASVAVKVGPTADELKKWKKDLAATEVRMETLNAEGAELEAKLSTNPHPSEIAEAGKRLKAVNVELQNLEELWLDLTAKLEV